MLSLDVVMVGPTSESVGAGAATVAAESEEVFVTVAAVGALVSSVVVTALESVGEASIGASVAADASSEVAAASSESVEEASVASVASVAVALATSEVVVISSGESGGCPHARS